MTALRLTLRFLFCVLATPFMTPALLMAFVEWVFAVKPPIVYPVIIRPWISNLRHPFTP